MLLFWPIVIPFLTAVATLIAYRSPALQRVLSLAGAVLLLVAAVVILAGVLEAGPIAQQAGAWPAPFGITLVADLLSAVMVTLAGIVAVAVAVFALSDITEHDEHFGHHALVHAMLAGICGAFLTGDLFNMYVWFEVMLIASFGLLVIGGDRDELDGATKYVGLNLIATVAFLAGVGLLYGATGALNMADLHFALAGRETEVPVMASAAFLIFAFASKAALFPTFFWLPASYHTPSFTTSALFAALLTKVGVYALIRVFTLVYDIDGTPIQTVLIWGSVATIAVGALGALAQSELRRVLGFGIITGIGSITLGLAVHTPLAIAAGLFYLFQDVLVKANLFLSAGGASHLAGGERFGRVGGLWRAAPMASVLFLLPALSLSGIPPFSGFWAKLLLLQASFDAGLPLLAAVVLASGFLTLFAMGRIWAEFFWADHPGGDRAAAERLPTAMAVPLVLLTLMITGIGIAAGVFVDLAGAATGTLVDPEPYLNAVMPAPEEA